MVSGNPNPGTAMRILVLLLLLSAWVPVPGGPGVPGAPVPDSPAALACDRYADKKHERSSRILAGGWAQLARAENRQSVDSLLSRLSLGELVALSPGSADQQQG